MATLRRAPNSPLSNFPFQQHVNGPTTFHLFDINRTLYQPRTPNFRYFVAEKENTILITWWALSTRDASFISIFIRFNNRQTKAMLFLEKKIQNFPTKKVIPHFALYVVCLLVIRIWFTLGFSLEQIYINLERLAR